MHPAEQLAAERTRGHLKLAEQLRCARRLRTLRRARRMELRAERRLIAAWRRAAELRDAADTAEPAPARPGLKPRLIALLIASSHRVPADSSSALTRLSSSVTVGPGTPNSVTDRVAAATA